MHPLKRTSSYNFGFTAASLRPELAAVLAEIRLEVGSWEEAKARALETNALQSTAASSGTRMERELRRRLETLDLDQLRLLAHGTSDSRVALCWLAAVKRYAVLFDLSSELLRTKLDRLDPVLREADYGSFMESRVDSPDRGGDLSDSTRGKIRRVILRMLREANILVPGPELGGLKRPVISPDVETMIRNDDPLWLAAFLFPESEIKPAPIRCHR